MRQRVEDLGRIAVLIDNILKEDLWDLYQGRNKDFVEIFNAMPEEKRDDLLHNLIYGISGIKEKIYEIGSIADGTDILNEFAQ